MLDIRSRDLSVYLLKWILEHSEELGLYLVALCFVGTSFFACLIFLRSVDCCTIVGKGST